MGRVHGNIMPCSIVSTPALFKSNVRDNQARLLVAAKSQVDSKSFITESIKAASFIAIQPTLALVDDRLAGEGTGKALGINDPILGWVILGVFTLVWAFYYIATKDLGGQRDEDGLGL